MPSMQAKQMLTEEEQFQQACQENLKANAHVQHQRLQLQQWAAVHNLVSGDDFVRAQGDCGADSAAFLFCIEHMRDQEDWLEQRDALSQQERLHYVALLRERADEQVQNPHAPESQRHLFRIAHAVW